MPHAWCTQVRKTNNIQPKNLEIYVEYGTGSPVSPVSPDEAELGEDSVADRYVLMAPGLLRDVARKAVLERHLIDTRNMCRTRCAQGHRGCVLFVPCAFKIPSVHRRCSLCALALYHALTT